MRTPLWRFGIWITIAALGSLGSTVDDSVGASSTVLEQKTDGRKALLDEGLILHQKGDLEGAARAYSRLLEVRQLWLVLLRHPLLEVRPFPP